MERNQDMQYQYQLVVNIVAEMVIDYLKATARDIDGKRPAVNGDKERCSVNECHQDRKAA